MKLNEVAKTKRKKQKINELDLSSFIGDYGSAAVKTGLQSLTGQAGQSTVQKMAQEKFVKDLVGKLSSEIQQGSKAKMFTVGSPQGAAEPGRSVGNQPATPGSTWTGVPGAKPAAPAAPAAKAAPYGKSTAMPVKPMAAPAAGTSPAPTAKPAATPAAGAKPVAAPAQARNKPRTGGKIAGQVSQTANAVRKRNARQIAADRARLLAPAGGATESTYHKLNAIFENIMQLDEATLSDFVVNSINKYTNGVPGIEEYSTQIKQYADQVQKAYGNGGFMGSRNIKKPLTDLARLVYTVVSSAGTGAAAATAPQASPGAQEPGTKPAQQAEIAPLEQVKKLMKQLNPKQKTQILQSLNKELGIAVPEPAIAESRKRK